LQDNFTKGKKVMTSNISTILGYNETSTSTTAITLENEFLVTSNSDGNGVVIENFLNMNNDAVPQKDEITIASGLPAADSYFMVTIAGPTSTETKPYFFDQSGADTNNTIAAKLAALINTHPDVVAKVNSSTANQIDVFSNTPGTGGAFTTTVDCLTASNNTSDTGKITLSAEAVAASGTSKRRKASQLTITLGVNTDGKLRYTIVPVWYNGANPPVQTSGGTSASATITGPTAMSELRGVA
jgi:hypothetical protein